MMAETGLCKSLPSTALMRYLAQQSRFDGVYPGLGDRLFDVGRCCAAFGNCTGIYTLRRL